MVLKMVWLFCIYLLISPVLTQDPCIDYILNQDEDSWKRSITYQNVTDNKRCDRLGWKEGWHRFTSESGTTMPTECPSLNSCGTMFPIWTNGSHPTSLNQEKTLSACISTHIDCCSYPYDIKVKKCKDNTTGDDFFTYYLPPVPGCDMGYCIGQENPCSPDVYNVYNLTTIFQRSTGNIVAANITNFVCDIDINPYNVWQRFISPAGDEMPTTCPPQFACGTRYPVWLNDTYPTVYNHAKSVKACINVEGLCCFEEMPIQTARCKDNVKNEDFFVYKLVEIGLACPVAYCIGKEVRCPAGQTSATGFTPCHVPSTTPITALNTTTVPEQLPGDKGSAKSRSILHQPGKLVTMVSIILSTMMV
eukprot:TCONS_00053616-protein